MDFKFCKTIGKGSCEDSDYMTDIVVCMPDTKKEGIEKLIEFYKKEDGMIYFKVAKLPKDAFAGDRCFICSNGFIIGSHIIASLTFVSQETASTLSDGNWTEGNYIIRNASTFEELKEKIPCRGFRGFRYRWWK